MAQYTRLVVIHRQVILAAMTITPPAKGSQGAKPPIPLKDITVTWPRDSGDEDGPLQLTGVELGKILEWLKVLHRPRSGNTPWISPVRNLTDVTTVATELQGFAYLLRTLGDNRLILEERDAPAIFAALGASMDYLAARFIAADMGDYTAKQAIVTIGAAPAENAR